MITQTQLPVLPIEQEMRRMIGREFLPVNEIAVPAVSVFLMRKECGFTFLRT